MFVNITEKPPWGSVIKAITIITITMVMAYAVHSMLSVIPVSCHSSLALVSLSCRIRLCGTCKKRMGKALRDVQQQKGKLPDGSQWVVYLVV